MFTAKAEKEVWGLAKVIARAHQPDVFVDPETTGTIDPPAPKVSPEDQAKRDANPNNKAGLMNGTAQPVSPAEKALLERLGQRREEIEARMRELDMREKLLDSAEKKLGGRVDDLKALEEKVEGPRKKEGDENQAVKKLVIMYEAMKPKDAARVFDRLALDILVPVVQQMSPRKMSEVLAVMSPEAAERLTVALSLRGRPAAAQGERAPLRHRRAASCRRSSPRRAADDDLLPIRPGYGGRHRAAAGGRPLRLRARAKPGSTIPARS